MFSRMSNRKAFTLIELMIVVAIIGILAAIAIPNFLKFQAKSKQSEAKTNLKGVYTAETGYFGENNQYANFTTINWEPVGTSRYNYTFNGAAGATAGTHEGLDVSGAGLTGITWTLGGVTYTNGFTAASFTAGAIGNVDNDTQADCWVITDGNILANTVNDV